MKLIVLFESVINFVDVDKCEMLLGVLIRVVLVKVDELLVDELKNKLVLDTVLLE